MNDLYSAINYATLIRLQATSDVQPVQEQPKQKTYYQPTRNPYTQSNQRKRIESQSQSKFQ